MDIISILWIFCLLHWPLLILGSICIINIKKRLKEKNIINWEIIIPSDLFTSLLTLFWLIILIFFIFTTNIATMSHSSNFELHDFIISLGCFFIMMAIDFYCIHYILIFKKAIRLEKTEWLASTSSKEILQLYKKNIYYTNPKIKFTFIAHRLFTAAALIIILFLITTR